MPSKTRFPDRWLLTGATGRVGRMITRVWRDAPPAATILCQSRRAGEGDFLWDPLTEPIPAGGGFAAMILLSGVTPATGSDMGLNVRLVEAGLSAAAGAGIGRVLVASSSAVYGGARVTAYRESDVPAPITAYGRAKAEAEGACAPWRARGVEVCCLRIGNVAGADALLLNAGTATAERPAQIDRFPGGGAPVRSYIGPATLARVLERLCLHPGPLPEHLNIAAARPVAMNDLADAAGMHWRWRAAVPGAQERITLDTGALEQLYAFGDTDSLPASMVAEWHRVGGGAA